MAPTPLKGQTWDEHALVTFENEHSIGSKVAISPFE